jgi:hypothetical protein
MSASKLKSYTYDKKILNKLTEQQCKDYIDNYEDKNIRYAKNPITGKLLFKNGTIGTDIYNWCLNKLSKLQRELLINKEDFLDILFDDKTINKFTSDKKDGKKFLYQKLMENDDYKDLLQLIETKLAYFSEKINSTSNSKSVIKPLIPILNTNNQIENRLNKLSPGVMIQEIRNMILSKIKEYLFERKQHQTNKELENFFWALKFILFNYLYHTINDPSSLFIYHGKNRDFFYKYDVKILVEYIDQIIDNKSLFNPKNVGSTSISISDSPISGNKRWRKFTEYDNDNNKKREAKLVDINKKCIDMFDIITHEDFNEFPLEKLEQIIPLGEANKKGQKNCYYSKTLYRLYQQAVNDGKVLPQNPITRKDLTEIEAEEIINKLKEIYPNIKKPVKQSKYHKNMEIWYYPCGYEGVDFTEYIIKYKYFIDPINKPTHILRISLMNFVIPSNSNRNLTSEQKSILLNAERALKMLWQDGKLISKKFPFEFKYPDFPNEYKYYLDDNNNIIWDKCLSTANMVLTNLS